MKMATYTPLMVVVICAVFGLVGCASSQRAAAVANNDDGNSRPRETTGGMNNNSFNDEQRRRLESFEAVPRVDQSQPESVPRLDAALLSSGGAPENEAIRRLLFEPPRDANQLRGRRFAILATDGVEEVELTVPYKFFRERGASVQLIAPRYERAPAKFGTEYPEEMRRTHIMTVQWMKNSGWFKIDRFLDEARVADYDALIVPGGTWSPDALRTDKAALNFVRDFYGSGKLTTSICHGPWVLLSAGVLKGKRVTGNWPLMDDLRNAGAMVRDEPLVVDGNLITSRHPIDLPQYLTAIADAVGAIKTVRPSEE